MVLKRQIVTIAAHGVRDPKPNRALLFRKSRTDNVIHYDPTIDAKAAYSIARAARPTAPKAPAAKMGALVGAAKAEEEEEEDEDEEPELPEEPLPED